MKIKCPNCNRIQEVSEADWKITQEGLPTALPWMMPFSAVHHFTCCDHIDMEPV